VTSPSTAPRSRAWVEIDLDAIGANAQQIQRVVGPSVGLLPMVKADAYGLGAPAVALHLARVIAPSALRGFGVATIDEGEELREAGWTGAVLVFSPPKASELRRAADAALTPCLSDVALVRRWAELARALARLVPFNVEIDTGIGRAGLPWRHAAVWGAELARAAEGVLEWAGCFAHFHSADEPDLAPTDEQWRRFRDALAALPPPERGRHRVVHISNSAGALRRPAYGEMVRPGIFLYGGRAGAEVDPRPAVAVRSRVVRVQEVERGATAGYGATYTAQRPERWGTLAIGYADGLPRALSPAGGGALVRGRRVPLIGRISMDVATIDLTDVPDAAVGDVATLIGSDGAAEIRLDEVAALCGTISYEILTGLTPRLPRIHLSRAGG
jgi:alanine racemase